MSLNYQHSDVMGALKATEEKIKYNYSSSQYVEVLDRMLFNALTPILQSSGFADYYVSGIVHHYMENGRRKISNANKYKFLSRSMLFLAVDNSQKPKVYKSLRLERNMTNIIIKRFLELVRPYKMLKMSTLSGEVSQATLTKMSDIERSIYYIGRVDLCAVLATVEYWHKQYCEFKNDILAKYHRMVTTQAQNYYSNNNSNIELSDLIQNYIMYASKAIDKFDHRQGALTTYIMHWLNHARNITASNENGTAFILPPNKRRECKVNNVSVPLEDDDVQNLEINTFEDVERESQNEHVRRLARVADPTGLARLSLGIQECLTQAEITNMRRYAIT